MLFIVPFLFLCICVVVILILVSSGVVIASRDKVESSTRLRTASPPQINPEVKAEVKPEVKKEKRFFIQVLGQEVEIFKSEVTKAKKDGYVVVEKDN
jgi:hypothetical protein